jgi:hypothetical protein
MGLHLIIKICIFGAIGCKQVAQTELESYMLYYIPSSISLCFGSENRKQRILKLPIITCDKHVYLLLKHYKYYHISMYNLSFFYEIQWNLQPMPSCVLCFIHSSTTGLNTQQKRNNNCQLVFSNLIVTIQVITLLCYCYISV